MNPFNLYLLVKEPTTAYLRAATYPSNTHFGASQAYGLVYEHVELVPGDEIHMLVGGTFVFHAGQWHEAHHRLSQKHPFEKVYFPERLDDWPESALVQLSAEQVLERTLDRDRHGHADYRAKPMPVLTAEWVYANATQAGGNIDYVVEGRLDVDSAAATT